MIITKNIAHKMIDDLEKDAIKNKTIIGSWQTYYGHIEKTALISEKIAKEIGLDSEKAYVMGLLHDYGKMDEQLKHRHHGNLGYEALKSQDKDVARICLLHMFPWNNIPEYENIKKMFFNNYEDYQFTLTSAQNTLLSDYDLLIQLADNLAAYNCLVTIEQRIMEYRQRHNLDISPQTIERAIKPRQKIKDHFDQRINGDIYRLLNIKI